VDALLKSEKKYNFAAYMGVGLVADGFLVSFKMSSGVALIGNER
jgi:hypothetical protein